VTVNLQPAGVERLLYTTACMSEALKAGRQEEIPVNVLREAQEFFDSALRVRNGSAVPGDFANYSIATIIAVKLMEGEGRPAKTTAETDEFLLQLQTLMFMLGDKLKMSPDGKLQKFFEEMSKMANDANYAQAMKTRCGHLD
jgi:hypothetical protein